MTRAAIFDVDGTLIDSVDLHAEAWVEALRRFGIEAGFASVRHEIGKGADQLLPMFVPADLLARREEEITAYRSDLFKRDYLARVRPFPGVPQLFRRIREAGIAIVLASSGKAKEVDIYARIAGITDLIDAKTSSDDVETSKPAGDIFAAALAKVAPIGRESAVVIGDTAWDVIAAGKVGLPTIALRCGGFPEEELRRAGTVAIYDDPAELLARFDGSPLAPGWHPPAPRGAPSDTA